MARAGCLVNRPGEWLRSHLVEPPIRVAGFGVEEPKRARSDGDLAAVLRPVGVGAKPPDEVRAPRPARLWSSSRQRAASTSLAISRNASRDDGGRLDLEVHDHLRAEQLAQLHEPVEASVRGRAGGAGRVLEVLRPDTDDQPLPSIPRARAQRALGSSTPEPLPVAERDTQTAGAAPTPALGRSSSPGCR